MFMKVIMFNSVKGGVGKTTLAAQFAVYLSKSAKVGIYDFDPQGNFTMWFNRRAELGNEELLKNLSYLPTDCDFEKVENSLDYCIVDSMGADSSISRRLLGFADMVVSPFLPSQADIDTVLKHNSIINQVKAFNSTLKLFYLFNGCDTHSKNKEFNEAMAIFHSLLDEKEISAKLIEYPVFLRKILRSTFSEGLSCFDMGAKAKQSKQEIENVIKSILKGGK